MDNLDFNNENGHLEKPGGVFFDRELMEQRMAAAGRMQPPPDGPNNNYDAEKDSYNKEYIELLKRLGELNNKHEQELANLLDAQRKEVAEFILANSGHDFSRGYLEERNPNEITSNLDNSAPIK